MFSIQHVDYSCIKLNIVNIGLFKNISIHAVNMLRLLRMMSIVL